MESKLTLLNKECCLDYLKKLGINFVLHNHEAAFTIEDLKKYVQLEKAEPIQNLLYNDKKHNFYLVIAKHDTKVEKAFWKLLGTTSGNMRLCDEDKLEKVLKVKKGHVTPFAMANDHDACVKLIVDKNLMTLDYWQFHPIENTASVEISRDEFLNKFLPSINRNHTVVDLTVTEVAAPEQPQKEETKKDDKSQETLLQLTVQKLENPSEWYQEVITKTEFIDYYQVSGCYILRPGSFFIWEQITQFFDSLIKSVGVENAYFPMFVTQKALETEKEHVQGFAPEVAWVTQSGNSDLPEPIAIRPTSETIMYPAYAQWIKSHRDLPLLLNQWTNVVRWEFKHPTPFIRTREFLWQEGHTAHATLKEADQMTEEILEFYRQVYEDLLCLPVIKGRKSENEKFPGALYTTTVETMIPANGRAIQAATSHNLGQNFSKMFGIKFQNQQHETDLAWQTSWGLTTRSIGTLILHHGDDIGLVLPPAIAQVQVVIVPVYKKDVKSEDIVIAASAIQEQLSKAGIRVFFDESDHNTPGWKYNQWEMRGVPLRYEVGKNDLDKKEVRCVTRLGEKFQVSWENLDKQTHQLLNQFREDLQLKARTAFEEKLKQADTWAEFITHLNSRCIVETPWCEQTQCEQNVKEKSARESKESEDSNLSGAAKTLCIPHKQAPLKDGACCFACGKPAKVRVVWGRSY